MTAQFRIGSVLSILLAALWLTSSAQTVIKCCNCNKTVQTLPTGFGEDRSVLRICDECKAKRCAKIGEIRALITKIIPEHSPTVAEWRNTLGSHRNSLDIYLSMLERSYCDEPATIEKIKQLRADLQNLNPGPEYASGQLLRERRKIAEIDLALEAMEPGSCVKKEAEDPLKKITCPPDAKPKTESDTQVLEDYIKDKLKEAGKTATEGTKLGDHLETLSKGEAYWGYLQQILAATCIPGKIIQAMTALKTAKNNREDTSDECNMLCRDLADWFVAISGNAPGRQMFMESCMNHCQ